MMLTTKMTYLLLVHSVIISYFVITLVSSNPMPRGQTNSLQSMINGKSRNSYERRSFDSDSSPNSMKTIASNRKVQHDNSNSQRQTNSVRLLNASPNKDSDVNHRHSNLQSDDEKAEFQRQLIEQVKSEILEKLRMLKPPSVTIPKSMLPKPLQYGDLYVNDDFTKQEKDLSDDYYGRTQQVILIAENVAYPVCKGHPHKPEACFDFRLSKESLNHEISSAELWVYKLKNKRDIYNQNFTVTEISNRNSSVRRQTSIRNGWLKFDLTNIVRRWMSKSTSEMQGLKISCNTCAMDVNDIPISNEQSEKPFIVINFSPRESIKRNKRNSYCQSDTTECCKEPLSVNFTDIGWDSWIIRPEIYEVNYCRGSCESQTLISDDHYLTIYELHKLNKSPKTALLGATCCVSKKTGPLGILFWNGKEILKEVLPNMVVESCGCRR